MGSALGSPRGCWNHNLQFHRWVLEQVPRQCLNALDVGCGEGILTRKLSERVSCVTAIDVSPEMIALARDATIADNIALIKGDFLTYPLPSNSFDFIAAIAVVHHVTLEAALGRFAGLLRQSGVLAIVGLARNGSMLDNAFSAASIPLSRLVQMRKGWWRSAAPAVQPANTFAEIRKVATEMLPGAELHRRLYFRYTMVWRKP